MRDRQLKAENESDFDLSKIITFAIFHFKTLLIFIVLGGIGGYSASKRFPSFRTNSKVYVRPESTKGLAAITGSGPSALDAIALSSRLDSFNFATYSAQKLLSQTRFINEFHPMLFEEYKKNMEEIALKKNTTPVISRTISTEWLALYLLDSLDLQVENSDYIVFKISTPSAELSHYFSSSLAQFGVEYLQEVQKSESKQARSYLETKINGIQAQRNSISETLKSLQTKSEFFGGSFDTSGFYGMGIDELKMKLHETELNIEENNRHKNNLLSETSKRELSLSEDSILNSLDAENEILEIRSNALKDVLKKNNMKKGTFAKTLSGFQFLKNELELLGLLHKELSQRQVQLDLEYLSLADRVSLFESSRIETVRPVVPSSIAVIGGMLMCFIIALALTALQSMMFPSILSSKDLAMFDLGSLGSLPQFSKRRDKGIVNTNRPNFFPEQFATTLGQRALKNLRRSFLNVIDVKKYKKIVVSSAHASNGKSTIVTNLALGLASIGKKVLIIDSDIINPSQTKRFNLLGKKGSSDYIRGIASSVEQCIHEIEIPQKTSNNFKLHVLPVGHRGSSPIELSNSPKFKDLIERAGESFDIVLIDTPPIIASTDGNEAIRQADMVILSIVHGKTKATEVMATLQNMPPRKHEDTYAILNFVPRWSSEETSNYYYSYLETNTKRKKKGLPTWKNAA